jgi:hypothetical protein
MQANNLHCLLTHHHRWQYMRVHDLTSYIRWSSFPCGRFHGRKEEEEGIEGAPSR